MAKNHDELKVGELPRLRMVAIDDVLFHEEPDAERTAKLLGKLQEEGTLRNPPVVATVDGNPRRILLDGANRVTALRRLGYEAVLVQEIDLADPGLVISQWHHAVERLTKDYFLEELTRIDGLAQEWASAASKQPRRDGLAQVTFRDRSALNLSGGSSVFEIVHLLARITALYHGLAYMDRVSYTNLQHLEKNYGQFSALFSFRAFTKDEIFQLTDNGIKVPSGITRVLVPKRALYFNLDLDVLSSKRSIADLNQWLGECIAKKIVDKSIRFYQESTFFFDE